MTARSVNRRALAGLLLKKTAPAVVIVGGDGVVETTGTDGVVLGVAVVDGGLEPVGVGPGPVIDGKVVAEDESEVKSEAEAKVELIGMGAPLVTAPP